MAIDHQTPPYASYAAIMGTFAGGLAAAAGLGRMLDRGPQCQTALDLTVLAAATFKAARTLARDEVASFIREPFVRGHAHEGGEEPVETGDFHQAIGELVTCSRCAGTWAAAGLTATQVLSPRFGRLLTWSLAAAGLNDFLQAGFAALTRPSGDRAGRLPRSGT
ncbi:MAG: DUF1360 domain-containing protein [Verrucomicrobiota bacterium]